MDAISQQRLDLVHPALAARIYTLDSLLEVDGIHIRVVRGFATWPEQDSIYAQGRTTPGPIVTNARAGYSGHNFSYAVDVAPDDPSFPAWHPDWNSLDDRWKDLLAKAKLCKLAEGAEWRSVKPDYPHLYLQEMPATPDDNLRYIFSNGGIAAVFIEIDRILASEGI